ncbi:hypothetical protein BSR29_05345 [Boudabousia liubingyangii]|uniref:Uncharacterized protein n=1 Tax=Boudabousia liubingyangii TaxID=1921764 RepID=A0A1Q5PLI7_9ACTO|nr:hypothetical protein [Boudabousia liubingyangii]OKL47910.1 hypothetical protein BSR29_05345 [Boudabousia liubingyangii]
MYNAEPKKQPKDWSAIPPVRALIIIAFALFFGVFLHIGAADMLKDDDLLFYGFMVAGVLIILTAMSNRQFIHLPAFTTDPIVGGGIGVLLAVGVSQGLPINNLLALQLLVVVLLLVLYFQLPLKKKTSETN